MLKLGLTDIRYLQFLLILLFSIGVETKHTNNWAVIVDTSRFWFNYRHEVDVLSIYKSVKRLGIPDSQIILMVADDMACNPRNSQPATIYNNADHNMNLYGDDVEVDYRGYEVTVENFLRLLTGRLNTATPRSKQLLTDEGSNILFYLSGHGGAGYFKFQDSEIISNQELADTIEQMWQRRRYNEIFLILDTCHASSMYEKLYSPNILALATSLVGEPSLTHHIDPSIGVYIADRYTYYVLSYLKQIQPTSDRNISTFLTACPKTDCQSTVTVRKDLFTRNTTDVLITDFFGAVRQVQLLHIDSNIEYDDSDIILTEDKSVFPQKYAYLSQFPYEMFS